MKLISFYGGPGTGKSTMAADVFAKLKNLGYNCELVTEYAKQLTWHKRFDCLTDQVYVSAKQYHNLYMLKDKVDFIVTDSPSILGIYYNRIHANLPKCFDELILHLHNTFEDQMNVFLTRSKEYNPKGRNQTEEEARDIDVAIKDILIDNSINFIEMGTTDGASKIVELIVNGEVTPEDIRNTKSVKIEGLVWIPEDSSGFSFYASGSNGAIYHIQFEDEQWVATVDCFPLDTTGDAYTCRAACERHNKEFS